MTGNTPLKLISMSEINAEEVQWLWYPYIPLGKLTILQGDPGEGKTSFILAVIAALTRGEPLPECERAAEPMNVIYQTAEDGLADTIKPRLESAGADCTRVLVIDESKRELTLCDARLEEAIRRTGAKLIVLDPLQAYLGSDVDMHRANEVRPVLKRLSLMAERTQSSTVSILRQDGKCIWQMNKFRNCVSATTKYAKNWDCRNSREMSSGSRVECPTRNTIRLTGARAGSLNSCA